MLEFLERQLQSILQPRTLLKKTDTNSQTHIHLQSHGTCVEEYGSTSWEVKLDLVNHTVYAKRFDLLPLHPAPQTARRHGTQAASMTICYCKSAATAYFSNLGRQDTSTQTQNVPRLFVSDLLDFSAEGITQLLVLAAFALRLSQRIL